MSSEAYNPSPPQEHITKETKSRREILKMGAAALAAAATGVLGARYSKDISSLPSEIGVTGNNDSLPEHEKSEISNSPLGAYQEGWRIIVPINQPSHPENYSAFIESRSNYLSDEDQKIVYSKGKFADGTQTTPWNGEKYMLSLLPFHADKEDTSAYITYGESNSGDIDAHQQTDRVLLKVVPFRDNVFLESEAPESQQDDLARLSVGAQTLDKLLPPVYQENEGRTQILIPDVYNEPAIIYDRSYEDRSVRGVVLSKDKIPLFESDSSVDEMLGELYFSAIGNSPDMPGEVSDLAVSAKDDFIEDLNHRIFQEEDRDPELEGLLSLASYDDDFKRYTSNDQAKNHVNVFGEMYAIARLFSKDEMNGSHLARMVRDNRKTDLRTVWNNFERILTGASSDVVVNETLPGLQKIHDALLRRTDGESSGKDSSIDGPGISPEQILP